MAEHQVTNTEGDESPPPRDSRQIILRMNHAENRRQLATWLRKESPYEPVVSSDSDTYATGDLCIVDPGVIASDREWIRAWKNSGDYRFNPVLLAHSSDQPPTSEAVWELIDETIRTPVNLAEFRRRVANLLERRTLSEDLAADIEETETQYRSVFQAVNDSLLVIDPERDQILDCNPRATELLGYSREELRSLSPCQDLHAENPGEFQDFLDNVVEHGRLRAENLQCQRQDNSIIEAEVSASAFETRADTRVIFSIRDVTEQREHQRRLKRQQVRLDELNRINRTLHETIQAVVNAGNRASLERDVCQRLSDSEVYQLAWIGAPEDDQIRPRAASDLTWEYLDQIDGSLARDAPVDGPTSRALRSRSVHAVQDVLESSVEYPWDGLVAEFDVRATAAIPIQDDDRLFGILNLYTTRENAFESEEQAILSDLGLTIGKEITGIEAREEAQRFQDAVEHAGSAVSIVAADGTIQYVNKAFEELTEYPRSEVIGDDLMTRLEAHSTEDFEYPDGWIQRKEPWTTEVDVQTRGGRRRHLELTIAPLFNQEGDLDRFIAIRSDLTESRRQRQQLQVLYRVLRHNLRTQLNVISGYADILQDPHDEETREEAATTISRTVDDLLTVSEQTQRIKQTFTPNEDLIGEPLSRVVRTACEASLSESPSVDSTLRIADVSEAVNPELGTAIQELVGNAVTHNDADHPTVTVTVEDTRTDAFSEVSIKIMDNGPGIPENERAVLREGEETPLLHGSGLGLWLVNWVVTELGGRIDITDNDPRGSIVTITVPLNTSD